MTVHHKLLNVGDHFPSKSGVVYVVDDDEAIRDSLTLLLNTNGFRVSCHESAERFLHALSSSDQKLISCALLRRSIRSTSLVNIWSTDRYRIRFFDAISRARGAFGLPSTIRTCDLRLRRALLTQWLNENLN